MSNNISCLSLSLSINNMEQYINNLTYDFSFSNCITFEENSFEEVDKSALEKYIKKNKTEKKISDKIS
jgi:hypothetical protein